MDSTTPSTQKDTVIKDVDVVWKMTWNPGQFQGKPAEEMIFEKNIALARLLAEEVIFINNHWWKKDWPEDAQKCVALCVLCNDVFAAAADAEEILIDDLEAVYSAWHSGGRPGVWKWIALRRKEMPMKEVIEQMTLAGLWSEETTQSLM